MTAPAPHLAEYMRRMRDGMRQIWANNSGLPALARKYPCFAGVFGQCRIIKEMSTLLRSPAALPVAGIADLQLPEAPAMLPCTQ